MDKWFFVYLVVVKKFLIKIIIINKFFILWVWNSFGVEIEIDVEIVFIWELIDVIYCMF